MRLVFVDFSHFLPLFCCFLLGFLGCFRFFAGLFSFEGAFCYSASCCHSDVFCHSGVGQNPVKCTL